ncbi:MAG: GNAT family N-acetyltransferase [Clostridium sp.]|uniref:GNAT family N-acetyltransferase n=1 Tax=Clostridium sp. TaxID=1506 RepID=UPI003028E5DE
MILKLNSSYKKQLLAFLWEEKEINLFIIGDVETYGFDDEIVSYWADFHENGEMIAVLMKFYEDFTVYSKNEFDILGFSKIIKDNNFKVLSGEKSVVEKFSNHIEILEKRNMYFAKLDKFDKLDKCTLSTPVRQTKEEDVIKIYELQTILNGKEDLKILERLQSKFTHKYGRGYHIVNDNNEAISSAETTAENSCSAMIVAVCTNPSYRKHGYATAVVSKLCRDLLLEKKTVCLFYDNPVAGEIYKNLGFEDIGFWNLWKSK